MDLWMMLELPKNCQKYVILSFNIWKKIENFSFVKLEFKLVSNTKSKE